MHLISPSAPYYQKADVLLTADCVAYALGTPGWAPALIRNAIKFKKILKQFRLIL
jgi:hypothetical protein